MIHNKDYIMSHLYKDEPGRKKGWVYNKAIRGWWKDSLFEVFEKITEVHRNENVVGNLCEIGTWYGRSFIPIRNTADETELTVAVDVFSKQQKQEVIQNIEKCFGSLDGTIIIEGSSQSQNVANQMKEHAPYRLLYVDGGHKYDEALSDLKLGKSLLSEHGLMFLDDYDNHNFGNDVGRALKKFVDSSDYQIAFTSCYQAFVCHENSVQMYVDAMNQLNWIVTNDAKLGVPNFEHPKGANSWRS